MIFRIISTQNPNLRNLRTPFFINIIQRNTNKNEKLFDASESSFVSIHSICIRHNFWHVHSIWFVIGRLVSIDPLVGLARKIHENPLFVSMVQSTNKTGQNHSLSNHALGTYSETWMPKWLQSLNYVIYEECKNRLWLLKFARPTNQSKGIQVNLHQISNFWNQNNIA